jgi:hypothetical protein
MDITILFGLVLIIVLANLYLQKRAALKDALVWKGELVDLEEKAESSKKELGSLELSHAEIIEKSKKEAENLNNISKLVLIQKDELSQIRNAYDEVNKKLIEENSRLRESSSELVALETRAHHILNLEKNVDQLEKEKCELLNKIDASEKDLKQKELFLRDGSDKLNKLMGRIDLYSRLDEFTSVGHFETPEYLYNTAHRYVEEIKHLRSQQKILIADGLAVTYPDDLLLCVDVSQNKKILDGQIKLLLDAFNIECDLLIKKVSPSNFARTLEQIEKKAEQFEKYCATLKCGFSTEYIKLKYDECSLQYEFKLKKQQEDQEQRLIIEQIREEARIQKQCEDVIKEAEKEELLFRRLIEKAKLELSSTSDLDKGLTQAKISELEARLADAEEKGRRAKSLAEQTRAGYVYIISNIGSFGEGVYKIGLTRRADPNERVDELSGASVPFPFDIHAKILTEDAPGLEYKLHQRFKDRRVNAMNIRKEFFRVSLQEIQSAIEEILGKQVDFIMTAKADDYYGSRRLLPSLESDSEISQNFPSAMLSNPKVKII